MEVRDATRGESCFHVRIPPDLTTLSGVRQLVEEMAARNHVTPQRAYDLKIAVSEACANAIEHSPLPGPIDITGRVDDSLLIVRVDGPGSFKVPTPGHSRGHRGLGLPLMVALVDEVSFKRCDSHVSISLGIRMNPGR